MNTTQKQKEIMLQWMRLHPQVARGRLRTKGESRKEMKDLLEDLARTINIADVGPMKTSAEWLKTWKDWKMYVLKKETKRRNDALKTGGGSPIKISFSSLEEELLEFITPEAAGLHNIPQGGFDVCESVVELDQDNICQQEIHVEEYENQPPQKRFCKNYQFLNTTGLTTQSLPPKMAHIQEQILKPRSLLPTTIPIQEQKSKTHSLSNEMVNIQKEKLILKKDELVIQQQLLKVQQSILVEIQQIRSIIDTFGHLE